MVEYPWGWRTGTPFSGRETGMVQNVQCFTVKWFDCAFGKGTQCSPRWIIKSTPLIYIFLLSVFSFDLTKRRSAGEIWLRDTLDLITCSTEYDWNLALSFSMRIYVFSFACNIEYKAAMAWFPTVHF